MKHTLDLSLPKPQDTLIYTVKKLPENYVRNPNGFYGYDHPRDNSPADRMRTFNEGKSFTQISKRPTLDKQ